MFKNYKLIILIIIALFPSIAFGAQVQWEFIVMGNGAAMAKILLAITAILNSDGFMYLMNTIAIIGIILLTVHMGFDPAKGAMKLVSFILAVWFVVMASTRITVPVQVIDKVARLDQRNNNTAFTSGNDVNLLGGMQSYLGNNISLTVSGLSFFGGQEKNALLIPNVPIMIALPAYLMSYTGEYLTQSLEQAFDMPASLTMAKDKTASGTFNLAAKLLQDAQQFKFVGPQGAMIKKNLVQYTADCFMNSAALKDTSYAKLMQSKDVWADMKTTGGFITKITPVFNSSSFSAFNTQFNAWSNSRQLSTEELKAKASISTALNNVSTNPIYKAFLAQGEGVPGIMSCENAYDVISIDLAMVAPATIMGSSISNWEASGSITAPLADQLTATMNWVGLMGDPSSHIKQAGMINILDGTYKEAASLGSGNDASLSLAIATATEAQKNSWIVGAQVFQNMMGYVYATLQAFVFGIIPIMIIALMIPGFGMKIFVNFGQILLWLALWEPMYAVINFLVYAFGQNELGALHSTQGLTYNNMAVATEMTTNLRIAASFLGTMVPMISWGIVKGAMAFTEFISHGVGSQFAGVAGQQAATGNVSLNNSSMDNASFNKSNYATQSTIGNQEMLSANGGFASMQMDYKGGSGISANGANVGNSFSMGTGINNGGNVSNTGSDSLNGGKGRNVAHGITGGTDVSESADANHGHKANQNNGESAGTKDSSAADRTWGTGHDNTKQNSDQYRAGLGVGVPSSSPGGNQSVAVAPGAPGGAAQQLTRKPGESDGAFNRRVAAANQAASMSVGAPANSANPTNTKDTKSPAKKTGEFISKAVKPSADATRSLTDSRTDSIKEARSLKESTSADNGLSAARQFSQDAGSGHKMSRGKKGAINDSDSRTNQYAQNTQIGNSASDQQGYSSNQGRTMSMQMQVQPSDYRELMTAAAGYNARYSSMKDKVNDQMDTYTHKVDAAVAATDLAAQIAQTQYNAAAFAADVTERKAKQEENKLKPRDDATSVFSILDGNTLPSQAVGLTPLGSAATTDWTNTAKDIAGANPLHNIGPGAPGGK